MADTDKPTPNSDSTARYAHTNPVEQQATAREANPGPGLADQAHGDLATDATAHLERSGDSLQGNRTATS